jgi:hypothetical protein
MGLVEQPLQEVFAVELQMRCHIAEDCGKRTDLQRIMRRNGDVMLSRRIGGQHQVAATLAGDPVTNPPQRSR